MGCRLFQITFEVDIYKRRRRLAFEVDVYWAQGSIFSQRAIFSLGSIFSPQSIFSLSRYLASDR